MPGPDGKQRQNPSASALCVRVDTGSPVNLADLSDRITNARM